MKRSAFFMIDAQMHLRASVLICTRNRASYLAHTIHKVASQILSDGDFEILVVDNGSTDETPSVVRECQSVIKKVCLRYIVETEVGLSAARNRAIQEARGQILCFLDDDAVPEPQWLQKLCNIFAQDENIMCAGGTIIPEYETELPEWFDEQCGWTFAPQYEHATIHEVKYPFYPYGANFAVRATAFGIVGMFDPHLGYKGTSLLPGEETELFLRIEQAGYKIVVDPDAVVHHIIPAGRLINKYFLRRTYEQGRCDAIMRFRFDNIPRPFKRSCDTVLNLCFDENPKPVSRKFRLWRLARSFKCLMRVCTRMFKHLVLGHKLTMKEKIDSYHRIGYFFQECVHHLRTLINW